MKQCWAVSFMLLTVTLNFGCRSQTNQITEMVEQTVRSQNEVNSNIQTVNRSFVELNKDLQQERRNLQEERIGLNAQFERLEQQRLDLNREIKSELAWSESLRFLAIVIAATMPLFLCAFFVWVRRLSSRARLEFARALLKHRLTNTDCQENLSQLKRIEHKTDFDDRFTSP